MEAFIWLKLTYSTLLASKRKKWMAEERVFCRCFLYCFVSFIFPHWRLLIRIRTLKPATLLSNMYFVHSLHTDRCILLLSTSRKNIFIFMPTTTKYAYIYASFSKRNVVYRPSSQEWIWWVCAIYWKCERCTLYFSSFVGFVIFFIWNFDPFFFILLLFLLSLSLLL